MKLIDKSKWPLGDWNSEPDYMEISKGNFHIVIIRQTLGHLCGYIGVPSGHPWDSIEYDNINAEAHGGLTFSGAIDSADTTLWYVGFDCAHSGDYCPGMKMFQHDTYKNFKYVMNECEFLLAQAESAHHVKELQ